MSPGGGIGATVAAALLVTACAPGGGNPCRSDAFRRVARYSQPYAGHWVIARGDTLTLPQMGDRFKLSDLILDTTPVVVGKACHFRGTLIFSLPKPDTLPVTWFGVPERVIVFGWPAELGPFAGIAATWWGHDSLQGSVLFDEQIGVQVRPGVTAQFIAGRRKPGGGGGGAH